MPTRFLGDAQRARYGCFPDVVDEDDIARCFHLDERDQTVIEELRGAHNRLGFAAQLGTVRFIGAFPSEIAEVPPVASPLRSPRTTEAGAHTHQGSARPRTDCRQRQPQEPGSPF